MSKWGNVCNRVGSCALTGAAAFASYMQGSEIIINGPLWCYFYALRFLDTDDHLLHERFHNSQPDNNAIVYGSEKDLTKEIERVFADGHKAEFLFVESSCSMSLIGDDLSGIVKNFKCDFPVITMDCGGLIGGFCEGYVKAGQLFIETFAQESLSKEKNSVNVLGLSDAYYNGKADREEICSILEKAGYKINCVLGSGSSEDLGNLSKAELNIVCCEELGLKLAEMLKKKFGTDFLVAGLPYGVKGTTAWLERINAKLLAPNLEAVYKEAKQWEDYLLAKTNDTRIIWPELWFDSCIISMPGTQGFSLAEALRSEWADVGEMIVISQEKVQPTTTVADEILFAVLDEKRIDEIFKTKENVLLLASNSEAMHFYKRKARILNLNMAAPTGGEVNFYSKPFVGYTGAAVMLERIWNLYIQNIIRISAYKA